MKKMLVVLVGILMLTVATSAFAESKFTIGVKAWANKWDWKNEYASGTSQTWDNGSALMVGPSLNLRLGDHFFIGANYLKSTKDYESGDWGSSGTGVNSFERTDLDVTMGVMFARHFGMFLGYKTIEAAATYSDPTIPITGVDNGIWSLKGPGFGFVASIPLGGPVALYGNLAAMKMKNEWSDPSGAPTQSYDKTGGSVELGIAVVGEHVSGTLGYKIQSFSGDDDYGNTHTDTFSGATLGLNLSF